MLCVCACGWKSVWHGSTVVNSAACAFGRMLQLGGFLVEVTWTASRLS